MAIKKALRGISGGADLLHPKLNVSYVLAAIVAVAVLLMVWGGGKLVFAKGKSVVQGVMPESTGAGDLEAELGL